MMGVQRSIFEVRRPDCPFAHLVGHDDTHCNLHMLDPKGYDTIGDNSEQLDDWMAEVRGVQLDDVIARNIVVPPLPRFIPNIPRGNSAMYAGYAPEFVTVNLGKLVSSERLSVATSITDAFGLPSTTKVIIQCYGKDRLIENMWPARHEVFRQLEKLRPYAITSVNYSIWDSQPHAEHFINIKRGLLTYEDLQELNLPTIPHVYWSSKETILAWVRWLQQNPTVRMIAINLQTMRKEADWRKAMKELAFFSSLLPHDMHYFIAGPQSLDRVQEIVALFPNLTLTNGYVSYAAAAHYQLQLDDGQIRSAYTPEGYDEILKQNTDLYNGLVGI